MSSWKGELLPTLYWATKNGYVKVLRRTPIYRTDDKNRYLLLLKAAKKGQLASVKVISPSLSLSLSLSLSALLTLWYSILQLFYKRYTTAFPRQPKTGTLKSCGGCCVPGKRIPTKSIGLFLLPYMRHVEKATLRWSKPC